MFLPSDDFVKQGSTDFARPVKKLSPHLITFNAQPIADAATVVRPANLRGVGTRSHIVYWLMVNAVTVPPSLLGSEMDCPMVRKVLISLLSLPSH